MQLYALCDQELLDTHKMSVEEFVGIAIKHNAKFLQYRNKTSDITFIKKQLLLIRNIFDGFLIINDKYELVEFCDGVHLGQEDLLAINQNIFKAVTILRHIIKKDKIFGISTHNEFEVLQANKMNLDYIGLGAYRDTSTKKDLSHLIGDKIDYIASISKHPVGVIGGVKLDDEFKYMSYKVIGSGLIK